MKQKLLKIVLLASAVTMALCGCDSTETPSDSNVTTDSGGATENENCRVVLSKHIYVKNDNKKLEDDIREHVTAFDVWSNAVGDWRSKLSNYDLKVLDTDKTGTIKVQFRAGKDSTTITVDYYNTVDEALTAHPVSVPTDEAARLALYNEEDYIYDNELIFTAMTDDDGNLYYADSTRGQRPATYDNTYHVDTSIIEYSTGDIEIHDDPDKMEKCVYDENSYTIKHYVTQTSENYYCTSYMPDRTTNDSGALTPADSEVHAYDIITDKNGRICYVAPVVYSQADMIKPTDTDKYWSCYKDYKENPVFKYAEDYDPDDSSKSLSFQKVLPEGGMWLFAIANFPTGPITPVDRLWSDLTAQNQETTRIYTDAKTNKTIKLTMDKEEQERQLNSVRLFRAGSKGVRAFFAADSAHLYAYCKVEAIKTGDAALIAEADTIYNSLLLSKLEEVQKEEVLKYYYEDDCVSKINAWNEKIIAAKNG